jgi:RecA/RadA recombinase
MSKLFDSVSSRFDSERTFQFSDLDPFSEVASWSTTGIPSMDVGLNTPGWPNGIVEIRGKSQTGKTTLSLHAIKGTQLQYKERAVCCILSSERRDNRPYAETLGIDVDSVLIHKVVTIEDVFNKIHQTVNFFEKEYRIMLEDEHPGATESDIDEIIAVKGRLRYMFVWDSLGQTIAEQEKSKMEERAEDDTSGHAASGAAARALSLGFRSIVGLSDDHNLTLMVINRPYSKVRGTPGFNSYGGQAIELFPTIRIHLDRLKGFKSKEVEIGQITQVKIIKSDFGPPNQKFNIDMFYGIGCPLTDRDIDFAAGINLIDRPTKTKCSIPDSGLTWKSRGELRSIYEDPARREQMDRFYYDKLLPKLHERIVEKRKESRK